MKRIVTLILLATLLFPWGLRATSTDSLLTLLPTLPHDSTRLHVLRELALSFQHTPRQEEFARALMKEARLQKDDRKYCSGLYLLMLYHYNTSDDTDSLKKWLDELKPIALKIDDCRDYFDGKKLLINNYIYSQQYEYAIAQAESMAEEAQERNYVEGLAAAYFCLANAYNETGRLRRELQVLMKAHALFPQLQYANTKMGVLELLMEHSKRSKDYTSLGIYLTEYETLIRQCIDTSPERASVYRLHRLYAAAYRLYYHTAMQQVDVACIYLDSTRTLMDGLDMHPYQVLALDACEAYYQAINRCDRALAINDSIMHHLEAYGANETSLVMHLRRRGDIFNRMGRYEEALQYYERSIRLQDSIEQVVSDKQIEEIKRMHHLDRLLQKQATLKEKRQWILLGTLLALIILSLVYYRHMRHVHRALRLSQQQTFEAMKRTEKANEAKGIFLADLRKHISNPIDTVMELSKQLAATPDLDEATRKSYSRTISTHTEQLIRLVNGVLDLSRLEAGMTKWQLADDDLIQIVREAVDSVHYHAPSMKVTLECLPAAVPVHTDHKRLMQLIASCLYYPYTPHPRNVSVKVSLQKEEVCIHIVNSPLADPSLACEESGIAHNINRLTLHYFHGTYTVTSDAGQLPSITITYPFRS